MRPMHQPLLDAIAAERQRQSTRRSFVRTGGKTLGGGALALSAAGGMLGLGLGSASAQDVEDDLDVANYALTLEHLEYAFYRDGLDEFAADAFADADYPEDLRANLEVIRDHERAHVDFLSEAIAAAGGEPVTEAEYDFGYDDLAGFLEVAMALENVGVSAYAGAAPSITDAAILAAALGVHSVEARHAAYLNQVNGELPFPDAVDTARSREEVLKLAGPFVASSATPEASAAGAAVEVNVVDFDFEPAEIEVAVGTTVTWTNSSGQPHTATARDDTFDTGVLTNGKSGSYTFEEAGTYPYVCTLHENTMQGVVTVV